jgi:hypothetical protein
MRKWLISTPTFSIIAESDELENLISGIEGTRANSDVLNIFNSLIFDLGNKPNISHQDFKIIDIEN